MKSLLIISTSKLVQVSFTYLVDGTTCDAINTFHILPRIATNVDHGLLIMLSFLTFCEWDQRFKEERGKSTASKVAIWNGKQSAVQRKNETEQGVKNN